MRNQLVYQTKFRNGNNLLVQVGDDIQEMLSTSSQSRLMGWDEALGTYAALDYTRLSSTMFGTVTGVGILTDPPFSVYKNLSRFLSYFALGSYTIAGKYNIDASYRQDHSSLFGRNLSTQSEPTWSIGGKWHIAREKFMEQVKPINSLDLRATYGVTGNSPFSGSASLDDVVSPQNSSTSGNLIAGNAFTLSTIRNGNLAWELTRTINIGLDFEVLHNRIGASIDYYYKNTTDLIGSLLLNPFSGYPSTVGNIGKLVNHGVEVSLRSNNITKEHFRWTTMITMGYNKNKLASYLIPGGYSAAGLARGINAREGYSIKPVFAYHYAGLDNLGDPQIYKADNTITKVVDAAVAGDMIYKGSLLPIVTGGISNSFGYKAFTLDVNIIYNLGGVMFQDVNTKFNGNTNGAGLAGQNIATYFLDRWKQPGDEAFTQIPSYVTKSVDARRRNIDYYTYADINVVSSSYAKIREATLSYDLPVQYLKRLRMNRARIFIQGGNFMIWKANKVGIDPEVPRSPTAVKPKPNYSLGVNFSF
ncbi:MAG: TonB-dependent receptor plug [Sediminibacterium sp.]|nr:TonB-dependent receptor plug [Sediminibacterium sp.]